MKTRENVVNLARTWIGKNEKDGSHKQIVDIYNSYTKPLPRGLKMQYNWSWCACTWSALAVKLGYTDIMPIEISCGELINKAKIMGIWQENDTYVPKPGDAILYDWDDNGKGDCSGWPDHVGTVEVVNGNYITVIEGNYKDSVKRRTISVNGKFIRGFITPRYDEETVADQNDIKADYQKKDLTTIAREVISGKWGAGATRKANLEAAGYVYQDVQNKVNEILNGSAVTTTNLVQDQRQPIEKKVRATCAAKYYNNVYNGIYVTNTDLYCRNDAGKDMKALCLIPKGTEVSNYGYFNKDSNGQIWLYITFVMDGVEYTGYSSLMYLHK